MWFPCHLVQSLPLYFCIHIPRGLLYSNKHKLGQWSQASSVPTQEKEGRQLNPQTGIVSYRLSLLRLGTPIYRCKDKSISRKEKGHEPFLHSVTSQSHIHRPRNKRNASLFEVNLSGGVYEAHGEDFSLEPLSLPVHSDGSIHLHDLDFGSTLNHIQSSFTSTSWAMISQQLLSAPFHHFLDIPVFVFDFVLGMGAKTVPGR